MLRSEELQKLDVNFFSRYYFEFQSKIITTCMKLMEDQNTSNPNLKKFFL